MHGNGCDGARSPYHPPGGSNDHYPTSLGGECDSHHGIPGGGDGGLLYDPYGIGLESSLFSEPEK